MISEEELSQVQIPENEDQIDDFELINQITIIRAKNNINWMGILKLAIKGFPKETRELMSNVTKNDREISELSKKLAEKSTFGEQV